MMSRKMTDAINRQINAELYSAYLYLSMQSYFDSINLSGFANWMHVQVLEEMAHAEKLYNHLKSRGARGLMTPIEGPPTEWDSPLAAFEAVLTHERKVTGLINNLADLAAREKDHAAVDALQWFIKEQVEEEASADAVVQQIRLKGKAEGGLSMIDRNLAKRSFKPPLRDPDGRSGSEGPAPAAE